jgi:hypothetical protein
MVRLLDVTAKHDRLPGEIAARVWRPWPPGWRMSGDPENPYPHGTIHPVITLTWRHRPSVQAAAFRVTFTLSRVGRARADTDDPLELAFAPKGAGGPAVSAAPFSHKAVGTIILSMLLGALQNGAMPWISSP